MKADFTRDTFHPFKHYTRVLMQQGRVQLDADWNEQSAILMHYLRRLAADVIGPCGGPVNNLGFKIIALNPDPLHPVGNDFAIIAGDFYVDGILCENEHDSAGFARPEGKSPFTITPDRWILDGAPLQAGDYLEIYDATGVQPSVLAVVTNASNAPSLTIAAGGDQFPEKWGITSVARLRRVVIYSRQPNYPMAKTDLVPQQGQSLEALIYLDVWERLITCAQDDSIREVALNGPDTAARAKLVWQVKWAPAPDESETLLSKVQYLNNRYQPLNRGLLMARVQPTVSSTDPCIISPTSNYRGPENQLYRVQVHTGSANPDGTVASPTFVWSRENGSPVFPILATTGGPVMTLETLGRDDRFGIAEGDWVEAEDDSYVLLNRASTLLRVLSVDRSNTQVTLSAAPASGVGTDLTKHPLLRRWDQKQGDATVGGLQLGADGTAPITAGTWFNLEDGVQIQFFEPDPKNPVAVYRTGDYWLIPARVATGNVEWPTVTAKDAQGNTTVNPAALPPLGITHHYAPLALADVNANGVVDTGGSVPPHFNPLVNPDWP